MQVKINAGQLRALGELADGMGGLEDAAKLEINIGDRSNEYTEIGKVTVHFGNAPTYEAEDIGPDMLETLNDAMDLMDAIIEAQSRYDEFMDRQFAEHTYDPDPVSDEEYWDTASQPSFLNNIHDGWGTEDDDDSVSNWDVAPF